jgi:hypothetical protein
MSPSASRASGPPAIDRSSEGSYLRFPRTPRSELGQFGEQLLVDAEEQDYLDRQDHRAPEVGEEREPPTEEPDGLRRRAEGGRRGKERYGE